MKKRFWLILLAVAFIVSTLAVTAFATGETPSLAIVNKSMSFNSALFMNFKVKQQGVADEEMSLLVWTAPQEQYTKGTETMALPVERTEADGRKVFVYRDIDSRKMTDTIYARAYANVKGQEVYSEPVKFSIVEYANTLHQISDYTAMYPLLDTMLQYGAESQKHFKYHLDFLASDPVCQIQVEGAKLTDGFTKGTYKVGSTVTITADAPESGMQFSHFETLSGKQLGNSEIINVEAATDETYFAIFKPIGDINAKQFAYSANPDQKTCTITGMGTYDKTNVEIPLKIEQYTVTAIGDNAFKNATGITSVKIPDTVTTLGSNVFEGCTGLTEMTIPASVTSIGNHIFLNCSKLSHVIYNSTFAPAVDSIFLNTPYIKQITFGGAYVPESICSNCSHLEKVVILNTANAINASAFKGCTNLVSISIPDSVHSIKYNTFADCKKLESIVIPEGVTTIEALTFTNCFGLKSVTIPSSVTDIKKDAFYNTPNIESFYIQDLSQWLTINIETQHNTYWNGWNLYANGNLVTEVEISSNKTTMDDRFRGCKSITKLTIPAGIASIETEALWGCSGLQSVYIDSLEHWLNLDLKHNPMSHGCDLYIGGKLLENLTFPQGTTTIDSRFSGCTSIKTVVIPEGVTSVGSFTNCPNLVSIEIPNGVTQLGSFSRSDSLKSITIPDGIAKIEYRQFENCKGLTSVVIPVSVKIIENQAFEGCFHLNASYYKGTKTDWNRISIGQYNTEIVYDTNRYYYSAEKPTTSGDYWHYVNDTIEIWEKLPSAGLAYSVNSDTSTCTITGKGNCRESIIFIPTTIDGYTVTSIGANAFENDTAIHKIIIPEGITSIEDSAFANCSNLESVAFAGSIKKIGNNAFNKCRKLNNIVFPEGVQEIGLAAFSYTGVTSVTIPKSMISINGETFGECSKINTVYYGGTEAEWNAIKYIDNNFYLTNAPRYYYSETQPTTAGNYWHWVDGVPTKW